MDLPTLTHTLTLAGFTFGCAGCDALEVKGATHRLTPELKQALAEHKPLLIELLGCGDIYAQEERRAIQHEQSLPLQDFDPQEFLSEADYAELTAPRMPKPRCVWCGGINHHAENCIGLPRMPWGKHEGRPLPEVPERYLAFVLKKGIGKVGHRRIILDELQRRFTKYRSAAWNKFVYGERSAYDKRNAPGLYPRGASDHNHPLTRKGHVMAVTHSIATAAPQETAGGA